MTTSTRSGLFGYLGALRREATSVPGGERGRRLLELSTAGFVGRGDLVLTARAGSYEDQVTRGIFVAQVAEAVEPDPRGEPAVQLRFRLFSIASNPRGHRAREIAIADVNPLLHRGSNVPARFSRVNVAPCRPCLSGPPRC